MKESQGLDGWGIDGKIALVTGAAQGIGAAVARLLAEHGAVVAAVDRHAAGVEAVAAELRGEGWQAGAFAVDVSDSAAVNELVAQVERELGPIGILVNAAGVLRTGAAAQLSDEDWAATFAVNTTGVFYVSRAVTARMAQRGGGAIVTVGSNAGSVPRVSMAAYAASKAASSMFTRCLALEYAGRGVRCNVVSPGSTDTPMQRALWADDNGAAAVIAGAPEAYRVGIPLGRIAEPRDIAEAVLFLASERARHITMHDLCVDGGAALGQ